MCVLVVWDFRHLVGAVFGFAFILFRGFGYFVFDAGCENPRQPTHTKTRNSKVTRRQKRQDSGVELRRARVVVITTTTQNRG